MRSLILSKDAKNNTIIVCEFCYPEHTRGANIMISGLWYCVECYNRLVKN
jgi:hypothetical protein